MGSLPAKADIHRRVERLGLEEARRQIAAGQFGDVGSLNHDVASAWLSAREAEARDRRDEESLSISRKALRNSTWAMIIAIIAMIIAAIAAKDQLIDCLRWIQKL